MKSNKTIHRERVRKELKHEAAQPIARRLNADGLRRYLMALCPTTYSHDATAMWREEVEKLLPVEKPKMLL